MQEVISGAGCWPLLDMFEGAGTKLDFFTHTVRREVDGIVVGGFAFTGEGAETIQLHFVGTNKRWMTRALLRAVFTYAFQERKNRVILGYIAPDRPHAVKAALKLGFKELVVIPAVDIHMMAMTREQCKWVDASIRGVNG
ncbi:MAG: GNAT family N-acetyltransferase [Candidatus Binatia bacterium]